MSPLTESDKYYYGNAHSAVKSKTFEWDVIYACKTISAFIRLYTEIISK